MTRSSRKNELDRAEFSPNNPDPRMRPVYSALCYKLRQMKALDDPSLSRLVIDDMIYHRFLFQASHPDALWYLMQQVHSYWLRSLGGRSSLGEAPQIEFVQAVENFFPKIEEEPVLNLNEDAPQNSEIDFESKELKTAVREAIQQHAWFPGFHKNGVVVPKCTCGREFDLFEQWANHVRSVIWRVMRESIDQQTDSGIAQEAPSEANSAD